jgi:hypothetical protein
MESDNRITAQEFPQDWRYYTLGFPTARYANFTSTQIIDEMNTCDAHFYSRMRIFRRTIRCLLGLRHPLLSLISNLSYRGNARLNRQAFARLDLSHDPVSRNRWRSGPQAEHCPAAPSPIADPDGCGALEEDQI